MVEHRGSTTLLEEISPAERRRLLGQVYGMLVTLARQKQAEQQRSDEPTQISSNVSASSRG